MRAWQVREYGHFDEVLELQEADEPVAGTGAVIRVISAGINFPDILSIAASESSLRKCSQMAVDCSAR